MLGLSKEAWKTVGLTVIAVVIVLAVRDNINDGNGFKISKKV